MSKNCVVHYENIKVHDPGKLTAVDLERYNKLLKAKNHRIDLGGVHLDDHQLQCDSIPNEFVEGLSYHGECYKKFTGASLSKNCIIHYHNIKISDQNKVTSVDQGRYEKLLKAKNDRIELGGLFLDDHQSQCDKIPDLFVEGLSYHRECYQQFTRASSELKKKKEQSSVTVDTENASSSRSKRSTEKDDAGRFPKYCMICKSVEKRIRKRDHETKEFPSKFTLPNSVELFRKAAEGRQDKDMLDAIDGVDLMVKDFMKHESCWRNYTNNIDNLTQNKCDNEDSYHLVRKAIKETVIENKVCISMDTLLELKGIAKKDYRSRATLKKWVERNYGKDIVFLSSEENKAQMLMSKQCLEDVSRGEKVLFNTVPLSEETSLRHAANILRRMVLQHTETAESLPWPPTVESLEKRLSSSPTLLLEFFKNILEPEDSHHLTSESATRLAESFAQDLMFGITKGTFLTLKHTALGLGLHNMVGQKLPIIILSRLGQSISYHMVREIETAQAELSEQFSKNGMTLPVQPRDSAACAPVIFWWDNFDKFVDTGTGAGSIHNTPGIAFQEETYETVRRKDTSIKRSKRTSLLDTEVVPLKRLKIDSKKNPSKFVQENNAVESGETTKSCLSDNLLCLWRLLRKLHENDQIYAKFSGFVINLIQRELKKTVMTYLPPIETPITEYGTLFEMFHRSQQMSKQCNMRYTHITLDCGAAIKAYHVLWNNPDQFKDIILHLGDFHSMQAMFGVIGSYVSGSGFEDIIYQLGLCQPGTMKALIKGKHYNQAWMVHEAFSEAVSRMFLEKYIPAELRNFVNTQNTDIDLNKILTDPEFLKFAACNTKMMNDGLSGCLGKTAQFWLRYVTLVDILHKLHHAIQTNDFEEKVASWKLMLPFFFCFNRTHYSRYGSYYLKSMELLDTTHPGAKEELMRIGISVRRNEKGVGQAVDLAGEQSYMRSAKTAGGLTDFQTKEATVRKWVLCRPYQAKFTEALKSMVNLDRTSDNVRKCLRPSQILKSNKIVLSIINCLKSQFTEPFCDEFDQQKLYNLVSGAAVSDDIADSLLGVEQVGKKRMIEFEDRMVTDKAKAFFDSIQRNKILTFANSAKKATLKNTSKEEVKIEKDVLGTLLAEGSKSGMAIDINEALKYPLSPVCASLSTADGCRRKTKKSDLMSVIDGMDCHLDDAKEKCKTYMLDLAAYIRSVIKQCSTVRDIATKLLASIPSTYETLYVMCDKYEDGSIKTAERQSRAEGEGERVLLKSPDMKVPYNINSFLSVGQNKEDLFNLIRRVLAETASHLTIYFCFRNCLKIKNGVETVMPHLLCDHEEADTMLVAYAYQIDDGGITVRSPSGDIDIVALFVYHEMFINADIFVDNGTGAQRKTLDISACDLSVEQRKAILGLHSLSGNDYVSSFFRKGKATCWKKMCMRTEFVSALSLLGMEFSVDEEAFTGIEKYVCALYGRSKLHSVNEARSSIFWDKYNKNGKIVDLCMLPPCLGNLSLHLKRSNYVAYIFRHSNNLQLNLEPPSHHGWSDTCVEWMKEHFPSDIHSVLISENQTKKESEEEVFEDEEEDLDEDGVEVDEEDDRDVELEDFS